MSFTKEDTARVKGAAILLLFFHHLFYKTTLTERRGIEFLLIPEHVIQPIAVGARVCVWIFVFLSAYGLAVQYEAGKDRETTLQFYIKRWMSLLKAFWPAYIFVFIGYWLVKGNTINYYDHKFLWLFLDAMGVADIFETPLLTGVWWYMAMAQAIVIAVPLLVRVCKKYGLGSYLLVFLILQFLPEGIQSHYGGRYLNYLLAAVLAVCCAQGALMDHAMRRRKTVAMRILEPIILLAGAVVLIVIKIEIADVDKWKMIGFVTAIAAFLIIVLVAKYLKAKCVDKVLRFLGKHSGNMFMVHAFLYGPCHAAVFWSHNALVSYLTLVVLSLLVSVLIETVKKLIRYDVWFGRMTNKLVKAVHPQEAITTDTM